MPHPEPNWLALGGPILWLIAVAAVLGLILAAERLLYLHRGHIRASDFVAGIKNILLRRRLVEALTVCEETPGPVAAIVKAAILRQSESEDRIRSAIEEAAQLEVPLLERRLGSLALIAQVGPLLGLLGTVLGLVRTFLSYQQGGEFATAHALSAGLWQALISTAAGVALGLGATVLHHFLSGRVRAIALDMEWAAQDIVRFLCHEAPGAAAPAETPSVPAP